MNNLLDMCADIMPVQVKVTMNKNTANTQEIYHCDLSHVYQFLIQKQTNLAP